MERRPAFCRGHLLWGQIRIKAAPASRAPRPAPGGHSPRAAATCALQTRGPPSPRAAERASGHAHRCGLEEPRPVELHKPCAGWLSRATHPPANTLFKVTGAAPTSLHLQAPREGGKKGGRDERKEQHLLTTCCVQGSLQSPSKAVR